MTTKNTQTNITEAKQTVSDKVAFDEMNTESVPLKDAPNLKDALKPKDTPSKKTPTKAAVLTALKNGKSRFISGEELSNQLGVSRTAVWKAIRSLREEGYPIESSTNKGYMLMQDSWLITKESLQLSLPYRYKNNSIYLYDTIDSTNTAARQLVLDGAPHGTVVIARQQTKGRGRLGRSFFSPREGIYMSIIIKPTFDVSKSMLVTSAAAVAVAEAIENICGIDARIKWVNDIFIDGKKVCGILTEGMTGFETGQIENLVIGIGINTTLKDFPQDLLDTVGAVEGDYSKSSLVAEVITRTLDFCEAPDDINFIDTYREKSLVIGKTVNVFKGKYKIDPDSEIPSRPARVLDIDKTGGLVVMYTDGTRETLTSGEITIRRTQE